MDGVPRVRGFRQKVASAGRCMVSEAVPTPVLLESMTTSVTGQDESTLTEEAPPVTPLGPMSPLHLHAVLVVLQVEAEEEEVEEWIIAQ
mmetsp:Transcript_1359/g.2352  ORF Transcript_1359/g.2352 Transcript_1359/m.2352 type:complete len:89 (-) Transcript_1359:669-935(-)